MNMTMKVKGCSSPVRVAYESPYTPGAVAEYFCTHLQGGRYAGSSTFIGTAVEVGFDRIGIVQPGDIFLVRIDEIQELTITA